MSYSGEIQAAGAAALAVYAAQLVSRAAAAGIRAVRERAQTKAVWQMKSRLGELTGGAAAVRDRLAGELGAAAEECYADHVQTLAQLTAAFADSPDTDVFLAQCAAAGDTMRRSLAEHRQALEAVAIAEIRDTMRRRQTLLRMERQEIEQSMQRITDEMRRREQAGVLAEQIIRETAAMLYDLRIHYGDSAISRQAADACAALLSRAETLAGEGFPEAALTAACAAQDAVLTCVTDLLTAACRTEQLCAEVQLSLETAQEMLRQREGDISFANTRSGKPVEKHIRDIPSYFRGAWGPLEQELAGLAKIFSGTAPCDHDPQVLTDLLDRLTDWQSRFTHEYALAYERIYQELLRQETGRLLAERYLSMGYRLLPLTAEDRAVSPLDSLILRLEKPDTGERLELRLNAVPDADGHIAMHILMDDHTEYPGTDTEIEAARQSVREESMDMIRKSPVGQGMQLRQRCRNPGVRDDFQKR